MTCKIPKNKLGQDWIERNVELAAASDGLLPSYNPDELKMLTGRGSHGTAAVRCVDLGAKGVHPMSGRCFGRMKSSPYASLYKFR